MGGLIANFNLKSLRVSHILVESWDKGLVEVLHGNVNKSNFNS